MNVQPAHFSPHTVTTFQQRFWFNSREALKGSPPISMNKYQGLCLSVHLPAEVSCSFSVHHVKSLDQVLVHTVSNWSPDPPAGMPVECVSQSEQKHPCADTYRVRVYFFIFNSRYRRVSLSAEE